MKRAIRDRQREREKGENVSLRKDGERERKIGKEYE
jgi:hypothetical protein